VGLLNAQLRQTFPDTEIRVSQLRGALVLEGQARNLTQVAAIEMALRGHLASLSVAAVAGGPVAVPAAVPMGVPAGVALPPPGAIPVPAAEAAGGNQPYAEVEPGQRTAAINVAAAPMIINLMRVPGVHQVLLKVQIGELNRTALREMGA